MNGPQSKGIALTKAHPVPLGSLRQMTGNTGAGRFSILASTGREPKGHLSFTSHEIT